MAKAPIRKVAVPGPRSRPRARSKAQSKAIPAAAAKPDALKALMALGNSAAAEISARYFKTGKGEYAEGDSFLGIRVPVLRTLARDFRDAGVEVALPLLKSSWHEARMLGLMLLVRSYQRGDPDTQKRIYALYLKSTELINNWDLVDLSAAPIVGAWLDGKPALRKKVLDRLARSDSRWERRIAMIATYHYIKKGEYTETLRLAEMLLNDHEDLIQKSVGWMLREVGKRDRGTLDYFLKQHASEMPRTMLRYAIEHFSEAERLRYFAARRNQ